MLLLFWMGLLFAAEDEENIRAELQAPVDPGAVVAVLTDTAKIRAALPNSCMRKARDAGDGRFELVYSVDLFRRKLTADVRRRSDTRVEWDHLGKKGFITRFEVEQAELTTIRMTTYVSPPGKPFRKYYAKRIAPAWEQCQKRFLENMVEGMSN